MCTIRAVQDLDPVRRGQLSRLIRDRREELGWNRQQLCDRAREALSERAQSDRLASPKERKLWKSLVFNRYHLEYMENCPARPLQDLQRRARLLGVCLALRLDVGQVNRIAGGL